MYTSSGLFLVNHTYNIPPWQTAALVAFGVYCTYLNWSVDNEKTIFRESHVRSRACSLGRSRKLFPNVGAHMNTFTGHRQHLGQKADVHRGHLRCPERQGREEPPADGGLVGHVVRVCPLLSFRRAFFFLAFNR